MAFCFKQFIVEDELSTMRVGTDAILLGAWADPLNARSILEIGAGCGVISLMLAQRSGASIDAIDLDADSIEQAGSNFRNSPWSGNLHAIHNSLREWVSVASRKYDLIITNPPFFSGQLPSPQMKKNRAHHSVDLSKDDLIRGVLDLLEDHGTFYVILPLQEGKQFATLVCNAGLHLHKELKIRPKEGKPINRILFAFGVLPCGSPSSEELVIRNEDTSFTKEYIEFTLPYYFSLC
jgi:tRNA1Val (adenine37-N6)-methyltransferase